MSYTTKKQNKTMMIRVYFLEDKTKKGFVKSREYLIPLCVKPSATDSPHEKHVVVVSSIDAEATV